MWLLWIAGAVASFLWIRHTPPAMAVRDASGVTSAMATSIPRGHMSSARQPSANLATQNATARGPQIASVAGLRSVATPATVQHAPVSAPSAGPPSVYVPPAYNAVPAYSPIAASPVVDASPSPSIDVVSVPVSAPVDVAPIAGGLSTLD